MKLNTNYDNLQDSYLFSTIARKVNEYQAANPNAPVIRLGIGDVTRPLAPAVVNALHAAVDEQAAGATFRGYGPEQGYTFAKEAVHKYYTSHGTKLELDEIFISDGAKSDLGNILDLFTEDNVVLIPDPVYPAYVDTNTMHGHKIIYMDANASNNFLPLPDASVDCDLIYICSPNNPTGATYTFDGLKAWVDYANAKGAIILFDAAYESFIEDDSLPRSIFDIPGAKTCAIEFCSLSKTAGFTGTRCGYTVVPMALAEGKLNKMWLRRQTTKYNGVPYIVQAAAAAVFTEEGQQQVQETLAYYKQNAKVLADTLTALNIPFTGGKNSPYLWLECPNGMDSWEFFDYLLENANVVGTPGAGFGQNGKHYFRLTAFGDQHKTLEAAERLKKLLG